MRRVVTQLSRFIMRVTGLLASWFPVGFFFPFPSCLRLFPKGRPLQPAPTAPQLYCLKRFLTSSTSKDFHYSANVPPPKGYAMLQPSYSPPPLAVTFFPERGGGAWKPPCLFPCGSVTSALQLPLFLGMRPQHSRFSDLKECLTTPPPFNPHLKPYFGLPPAFPSRVA